MTLHRHPRLLGCLVLALMLTACAKSPESTVEGFYRAVSKGEISEAKSYLSVQIVSRMGDSKVTAALTSEALRVQKCGGVKTIEVRLTGEGEVRRGETSVTYGGSCPASSQKTTLIKEDGKWKITANK